MRTSDRGWDVEILTKAGALFPAVIVALTDIEIAAILAKSNFQIRFRKIVPKKKRGLSPKRGQDELRTTNIIA